MVVRCPLRPREYENTECRKSAIRDMRTTYQKASQVLALDRELANRSKDSSITELYIRLKLSGWTRRLWTLQEGSLAKEVHIQFADGARTLQEMDAAMQQKSDQPLQGIYLRYRFLAKTFFGPYIRGPTQQGQQRMMGLWKAVQWRSTSHAADEPVCLATLLGLDPGPILDIPPENPIDRMIKFLCMAQPLPLVLLFQPPPRMQVPGFRWAPTSLLNCFRTTASNPFNVVHGTGEISPTGKGLVFARTGLEFCLDDASTLSLGSLFRITVSVDGRLRMLAGSYNDTVNNNDLQSALDGAVIQRPAVITVDTFSTKDQLGKFGGMGVLVDIVGLDQGTDILEAHFISLISLLPVAPSVQFLQAEFKTWHSTVLPESQKWRVC